MEVKTGDKILIKVGDREIETSIDENDVQRLPLNSVYKYLFDENAINLNKMAIRFHTGLINFEDYLDFYLNIGYSVSGFAELSSFEHLEIRNPLWEK